MTTPATIVADINAANPGDVLDLDNGDYGSLSLTNEIFDPPITLRSEVPHAAIFGRIKLTDCEGFVFDGVKVKGNVQYVIETQRGNHITFEDCVLDTDYTAGKLIYANFTKDLKYIGCHLAKMSDDGWHFSGVDGFEIRKCTTGGIFQPGQGAHIDHLQMRLGTSNGLIEDNVLIAMNLSNAQGIFWDDITAGSGQVFKNITVRNNVVVGMANCIRGGGSTAPSSGCSARNNTCVSVHPGHALGVVNIGSGVDEDNLELGEANFNDYYEGEWGLGMTIEDFRPKPGTLGETSGAFKLINEILSGETPEPGPEPEPDVDTITLVEVTIDDPEMGAVAMVGGKVEFTPNPGYYGPVSGTYTIRDEAGGESSASWSGEIEKTANPNPPPRATADHDAFTVPQGTAKVTIDVMANDFAD